VKSKTEEIILVPKLLSCRQASALSLNRQRLLFKIWQVLTDALALGLAFGIAYFLRFDLQIALSPEIVPNLWSYPRLIISLIALLILLFALHGLYDLQSLLGGLRDYSKIFNSCTTGVMIAIVATFIVQKNPISRGWLISAWILSSAMVMLNRHTSRRITYALRSRGFLIMPAAILGANEEAAALAADLNDSRASGLRIIGFVSSQSRHEEKATALPESLILGSTGEIASLVKQYDIEDLIVAITAVTREELLRIYEEIMPLSRINLRLSSGLYEILKTGVSIRTLGSVPLMSLDKVTLKPAEMFIKSSLEYALALTGLCLLSPLFLLLGLLIKWDSPGPVFFRRKVLGLSGKEFDAYKFRTMYATGDHLMGRNSELARQLHTEHKLKHDPRITKIGRFLRKYSLDELPQLFNVLRGQMSLVGPRMISPEEREKYGRHKMNLLTVKPGMTGLWQVSGRSDLSYEERVRLDMFYIRNYSLWLDLQILFIQTFPAVLKGRGAY
jgi:exopolysaccharide biosynthesis polyprenyl glycosylphosphotransferase